MYHVLCDLRAPSRSLDAAQVRDVPVARVEWDFEFHFHFARYCVILRCEKGEVLVQRPPAWISSCFSACRVDDTPRGTLDLAKSAITQKTTPFNGGTPGGDCWKKNDPSTRKAWFAITKMPVQRWASVWRRWPNVEPASCAGWSLDSDSRRPNVHLAVSLKMCPLNKLSVTGHWTFDG